MEAVLGESWNKHNLSSRNGFGFTRAFKSRPTRHDDVKLILIMRCLIVGPSGCKHLDRHGPMLQCICERLTVGPFACPLTRDA